MDRAALHRFDLNLVKVFLAIGDSRSLTGAGEALGLTQPSVSHALKRLREAFGDPLFLRVANRMEPTPAATRLRAPLEEALHLMGQALGSAQGFDAATSTRTFRIVLSDTGEFVVLPRLLALVAREAPGVAVESLKIDPAEIEAALRGGRADLSVGYQPLLEDTACEGTDLLTDRLVCLLRQGHPALAADWSEAAFAGLSFLDVGRDATGYRMARDVLADLGLNHRVVARLEHFTVLPEVVRRTDHAALFPASVLGQMRDHGDLVSMDVPVPIPPYAVKAWRHGLFRDDAGLDWLTGALRRALRERTTAR
ncbi:MAG: LysR family transcriptional regulator [Pseudooceanicola sp.]|nr:LysR family transcriptional regulator [Pseudooceanicola sp.]